MEEAHPATMIGRRNQRPSTPYCIHCHLTELACAATRSMNSEPCCPDCLHEGDA